MSWRPRVSATPRRSWGSSKKSAQRLVRRAGPMKNWVYVNEINAQSTSGVGGVYVMMPLMLASDYEDNQAQQRERVVLSVCQLRAAHVMTAQSTNAASFEAKFALVACDLDTAATIASNNDGPWVPGAATFEDENVQLLRSWGYVLATNEIGGDEPFLSNSHRVWMKSWKLNLKLKEPVGVYLILQGVGIGTNQTSSLSIASRFKMRSW